jgi:hypothetical protein
MINQISILVIIVCSFTSLVTLSSRVNSLEDQIATISVQASQPIQTTSNTSPDLCYEDEECFQGVGESYDCRPDCLLEAMSINPFNNLTHTNPIQS